MPKYVVRVDPEGDVGGVDDIARGVIGIDINHDKVHDGDAYTASFADTSADETSGSVFVMSFPGSGQYHMEMSVTPNNAGLIEVWDDVLVSGGTVIFSQRNNRTSTNSSIVNFYHTPQSYVSGTGNLLWSSRIGADKKGSVQVKPEFEWVFQSGDAMILYRPDADNKQSTIIVQYYEVLVIGG